MMGLLPARTGRSLRLLAALGALALPLLTPTPVAASSSWDLTGTYTIVFTTGGTPYTHSMTISSMDTSTGAFSGTGYYVADPTFTWNITGTVTDSSLTFTLVYTGNSAGYTLNGSGTIASDGTLSGTASDGTNNFTWATTSGAATPVSSGGSGGSTGPTTPDQCKDGGWRTFTNPTFRNQGDCVSFVVAAPESAAAGETGTLA